MKKIIFILIMLAPFFSEAKNVWAFLTYSTFNSPEGPYIETYLTVAGNSVKYVKKDNGKYQATVDILMTFKQDTTIKAFKKYELKSPEISDTTKNSYEFIDEQRFLVPNGTYNFVLQLADKNNPGKSNPFSQSVVVDYPSDKPCFSGIQLVKTVSKSETETVITKSGYDLVPNVYNYYSPEDKHMTFYCELYNMNKVIPAGQKFILTYYIESYENNMKFNDLAQLKSETAKPVNVVLADFNIENLATGQYNLIVEAINQKNEVVASQKLFIQRSNPNAQLSYNEMLSNRGTNSFVEKITNRDTLKEYISSTFPISSGLERSFVRNVLKSMDLQRLQDYFYGFWMRRDKADPEHAWLLYNEQVKKVQYNFGTRIKKGYQTDRGRVYLEYGPPNTRVQQYFDPNDYPYEIWQYYTLKENQRNKKFVFYSPDMVTSDFFLLHSDALGETNNPSWQIELQGRTYAPHDLQDTQSIQSWGGLPSDYWDLPN
ncbi:MAG: GWxTD domain-containing protein [Bacteroidales bacterium]|jgi:GWxTD domain-containing protein